MAKGLFYFISMRKINTSIPTFISYDRVAQLITLLSQEKEDLEVDWNSNGGSTGAGQVFMAYLNNSENKINSDTAGLAASMGAFLIPFFNNSKGANQSDVMIHSVAGGEGSTHKHTNQLLYDAWANKIDLDKFNEITGKTLKEVMFPEDGNRIDVWLTGKQCGQDGIKLFDETYDLLDKAASINKVDFSEIDYNIPDNIKTKYAQANKVNLNNNEMEIKDLKQAELKSGNPSVYNAIEKEAVETERKRVASILKYAEYDMDKANEMIEKGATLGVDEVEHFMEKKFAKKDVRNFEDNSEKVVTPGKKIAKIEKEKTAEEEEVEGEKSAILEEIGFNVKDN